MPLGMLEPEFEELYSEWKTKPSPDLNAKFLEKLEPTISGATRMHAASGSPLLATNAKLLALEGLKSYDPKKSKLQTHLYNHLQGLRRINRQQSQIVKVPERISIERAQLETNAEQLTHELGREPTDAELMDQFGYSPRRLKRLRLYHPGVAEGTMVDPETGDSYMQGTMIDPNREARDAWMNLVYDDMDDYHKKVMEYTFGLNGNRKLQNKEIAMKLGKSPGAISQAKSRIQQMLDQEQDLGKYL